ncbi:MAG: ABC transporter permease, partial [Bacteroidetes bacterium]|nr:ABC transporter permease [Bacteroidota bacterium]
MLLKEIQALIAKDFRFELRHRYVINGMFLYVVAIVFVSYLSFIHANSIDKYTWNALFWVILMFVCMQAVSGTFVSENINRQFYYFTLASPRSIIISKIIYNSILLFALSIMCYAAFVLFFGDRTNSEFMFLFTVILGS